MLSTESHDFFAILSTSFVFKCDFSVSAIFSIFGNLQCVFKMYQQWRSIDQDSNEQWIKH